MKITVIAGAAVLITLAACGGNARAAVPPPLAVSGEIDVQESCFTASQDYPDITGGAQVVVTSPSGRVVDTGTLAGGTDGAADSGSGAVGQCSYPFTLTITLGQPRYGIAIGHNRGTIWFTPDQMRNGPVLSLG